MNSGLVYFVSEAEVDRSTWVPGLWPRRHYLKEGPNLRLRRLEGRRGVNKRIESELRWSRAVEDRAFALGIVLDRMQLANRLGGRAHLYLDHHPHLEWANASQWDETVWLESLARRAQRRRLLSRLRQSRSISDVAEALRSDQTVPFLLRQPVPKLSFVSPRDLVSIHESDEFGEWRLRLHRYVRDYHGDPGLATDIAGELRAYSKELESAVSASPALDALRAGAGIAGVGALSVGAVSPMLSPGGIHDALVLVAGTAAVDTTRRLVAAYRQSTKRACVQARSSVARAAAARFEQ